jgi:hypothetical protein
MEENKLTAIGILRVVADEFNDVPADKVNTFIELVKPLISEKRFGSNYQTALAYLAAHKMKMAGYGDNTTGKVEDMMRVSSYSEGEVSVSYAVSQNVNSTVDAEYALTSYGLQFLSIRRLCIIPILSAGERR